MLQSSATRILGAILQLVLKSTLHELKSRTQDKAFSRLEVLEGSLDCNLIPHCETVDKPCSTERTDVSRSKY